jgi:hypothetical protein
MLCIGPRASDRHLPVAVFREHQSTLHECRPARRRLLVEHRLAKEYMTSQYTAAMAALKSGTLTGIFLLCAFLSGCGSGGGPDEQGASGTGSFIPDTDPPPTAAGAGSGVAGLGSGPAPLDLGTSANFVILSVNALTNQPPSSVIGNIGLTKASGSQIGLSCSEVSGQIVTRDSTRLACGVTDGAGLAQAEVDADNAYLDALARAPDYSELGDGDIGGLNLGPATYVWSTDVTIPSNVILTGGPNDVWIFQLKQGLDVSPGVQVILKGGASAQNVYWVPYAEVQLREGSQMRGILLPAARVVMGTGASVNGKLLAAAVQLDHNTVGP